MGFVAIAAASPGARCMVPGSARAVVPRSRQAAAHIPAIPGFSFTPRSKSHESATTRRIADDPKQIAHKPSATEQWSPAHRGVVAEPARLRRRRRDESLCCYAEVRTALADSSTREYPAAWGEPAPRRLYLPPPPGACSRFVDTVAGRGKGICGL